MPSWNGFLLASLATFTVAVPSVAQQVAQPVEPVQAKSARPTDAAALFAAFAKIDGLEARFVEDKHLALLAVPLHSRGRLYFMRPGYLARVVEKPGRSTLVISPRELRMTGQDGVETIDLRQNADVRLFVTSLVRVFTGDKAALERSYDIAFVPDEKSETAWTLTLTPRKKPLTAIMRHLRLHGDGFAVVRIEVREPNGDHTVTHLEKVDPKRRFDDEEKKRVFGIRIR